MFPLPNNVTNSCPGAALAGQTFDKLKVSNVILLPIVVYGDCMAMCSILYTCQQCVWLKIAESTNWIRPQHYPVDATDVCILPVRKDTILE